MFEHRDVRDFLAMISDQVIESQRANARSDALLNPFDHLMPNEVRISRILAMLLDPRGVHGQGCLFLSALLSTLNLDRDGLMSARVHVERATRKTKTRRRIDIMIETAEWIIGIENKVWGAPDQNDQVADYLRELSSLRPNNYVLLYLTPDGAWPSPQSITQEQCKRLERAGNLKIVTYASIEQALDNSLCTCSGERARWFMQTFRDYIRQQVLGKPPMIEANSVITSLMQPGNEAQLAIALELFRMKGDMRGQLKNRLFDAVTAKLPPGWCHYRDREQQGPVLGLKASPCAPWFFTVELEEGRYWYGLRYACDATERQRREVGKLCERLALTIPSEKPVPRYTPYWREFDGQYEFAPLEYSNWDASVKPWLDMANGVMAENLLAAAQRLDLSSLL